MFAGIGNTPGDLYKRLCGTACLHLREGILSDCPQAPLVQNVKVAGINAPITLYDKLDGATTSHAAGLRRFSHQNGEPIVELPDTNIVSLPQVRKPQVKQPDEKIAVALGGQMILLHSTLLSQWFQTGDELQPAKTLFFVKLVDLLNASCVLPGHNTKHIIADPMCFKEPDSIHDSVPGPPAQEIQSVSVVQVRRTVQGQSNQEMVLRKEGGPLGIDGVSICLNGVVNRHPRLCMASLHDEKLPEKVQAGQGWFTALKRKGAAALRIVQRGFYDLFHFFQR